MECRTIGDVIYNERNNDSTALICKDEELNFKQLWNESKRIAERLIAEGVHKSDRVALDMGKSAEYVCTMLAVALCGAIGVTIDRAWPDKQREHVISDSAPVLIIDEKTVEAWRRENSDEADKNCFPKVNEADPFWIVYTSGSTGEPKGSVIYHQAILAICEAPSENRMNRYLCDNCNRILVDSNLSFIASNYLIWLSLCNGKTMVIATEEEAASPELIADCIVRNHVDCTGRPQSWIVRALDNPDYSEAVRQMKMIILGGEKHTEESLSIIKGHAKDAEIFLIYGSTEVLIIMSHHWMGKEADDIGEAVRNAEVYVLDDSGEPVNKGMPGEICFGGKAVSLCHYWNAPKLDEKKYESHESYGRIYHTGDMGMIDEEGHIHITGRIDSLIKVHGVRIEPEYPERVIREYDGISEVVVMPVGDDKGKTLCAWYSCKEGNPDFDESGLRKYLADTLPYYMIPAYYCRVESFPLNMSGKLDRKILFEQLSEMKKSKSKEKDSPYNYIEDLLCRIFAKVLHVDGKIGANENFFELGGDSISGLEASYLMSKEGYPFEIKWLYASPTPSLLAGFINKKGEQEKMDIDGSELKTSQKTIAEKAVGKSVSAVHPVSILVSKELKANNPWMRLQAYALDRAFSADEFKERIKSITKTHEMLRSVFFTDEGQFYRAVFSENDTECFYVDLTCELPEGSLWSDKQKRYFDQVTRLLLGRKMDPFKDVMFQAGLIRISKSTSILILFYSHLLFDMIGIDNLVIDLLNEKRDQETSDSNIFERRTRKVLYENREEAAKYWDGILINDSRLFKVLKFGDTANKSSARIRLTGDKNARFKVNSFCEKNRISFASLMHLLLGRALVKMSEGKEVSFLSVCSGRDHEEIRLAGMCAQPMPFKFNAQDTFANVQEQIINSQNHAWLLDVPGAYEEQVRAYLDGVRLDIIDDNYHERIIRDCTVYELQKELALKELILQHEQKQLRPEEDGGLMVYVDQCWSELYVIEFETGVVDADFAYKLRDALRFEVDLITGEEQENPHNHIKTETKKGRNKEDCCEFAASVLTPVHEVRLDLLERAYKSLRKQQFGFDNLEWVILLHNCSDSYKKEIYRRFGDIENVMIEERDVNGTGLAYARSELINLAGGKYLFFLDGDDEITPSCIKVAVSAMDETGADMSTWAVDIRSEDSELWFCCDADPKDEKLVIDRGDPRMGSTLCFSGPGLWAHAFRRTFIKDKNVCFDVESPAGTTCLDVIFVFNALLAADRLVILPRLTGYVYYYGIGLFNAAGYKVAYDMMSLVERYRDYYRDAGLFADNLMWLIMGLGLIPTWRLVPYSLQSDYQKALKDCVKWLKPPRMNWKKLQKIADYFYTELIKIAGQ